MIAKSKLNLRLGEGMSHNAIQYWRSTPHTFKCQRWNAVCTRCNRAEDSPNTIHIGVEPRKPLDQKVIQGIFDQQISRTDKITLLANLGMNNEEIASLFGITNQRVGQIRRGSTPHRYNDNWWNGACSVCGLVKHSPKASHIGVENDR